MRCFLICLKLFAFSLLMLSCDYAGQRIEIGKELASDKLNLSFIDDLDANAYSEIVIVERVNEFQCSFQIHIQELDSRLELHAEPIWADELLDVKAYDLTGNGRKEILYTYQVQDSLYLKIYSPFSGEEDASILDNKLISASHLQGNKRWQGHLRCTDFADLNHDGFFDILMVVSAGYDMYPRGVLAYDYKNQKRLWYYPVGPIVNHAFFADLDNNGVYEIYLNNWAPVNGAEINNTDDAHSYFLVLDEGGNLLYRKTMGGEYSGLNCLLVKFDSFGDEKLITLAVARDVFSYTENHVVEWGMDNHGNFQTKKINSAIQPNKNSGWANLLYNNAYCLTILNKEGQLCILDSTLRMTDRLSVDAQLDNFIGSFDLNLDGSPEHIWSTIDNICPVMDNKFSIIDKVAQLYKIFKIEQGRNKPPAYAYSEFNGLIKEFSLVEVPLYERLFEDSISTIVIVAIVINLLLWLFLLDRKGIDSMLRKQLPFFDQFPPAVLLLDRKGRILGSNKKMENLLDTQIAEIKNKHYADLFKSDKRLNNITRWLYANLTNRKNAQMQFTIKRKEVDHSYEIFLWPIYSRIKRFKGALLIFNDITPVITSQKTMSWLTVAQKLAHEIKNPLTAIRLSMQRIKMEYDDDEQLQERLSNFIEGNLTDVSRIQSVIDDFMRFSKIDSPVFKPVDLRNIVEEAINRRQLTLPEGIQLKAKIQDDVPEIQADQTQLSTVLSNLIDNALQASYTTGHIQITVRYIEKIVKHRQQLFEKFVELEISDTGTGMSEEIRNKIFLPFYTTKSSGSGLGMNIVKNIIEEHRGTIEVFSKEELGTRVTVRLPVTFRQEQQDV